MLSGFDKNERFTIGRGGYYCTFMILDNGKVLAPLQVATLLNKMDKRMNGNYSHYFDRCSDCINF